MLLATLCNVCGVAKVLSAKGREVIAINCRQNKKIASHVLSEAEQADIREYVQRRAYHHPKTNVCTLLPMLAAYLILPAALAWLLVWPFSLDCIGLVVALCYLVLWLLLPNYLLVTCVSCYQHYASVDVRRTCLCKPTCSEYAILVLRKSPFPIAAVRIAKRLFVTCRGTAYKLDPP